MELAELFTRKIFHKLSLLKYKFGYPQDLCPSDITVLLPVAADEILYSWDMKDVRYDMICSTSITQPIPYTVCVIFGVPISFFLKQQFLGRHDVILSLCVNDLKC